MFYIVKQLFARNSLESVSMVQSIELPQESSKYLVLIQERDSNSIYILSLDIL